MQNYINNAHCIACNNNIADLLENAKVNNRLNQFCETNICKISFSKLKKRIQEITIYVGEDDKILLSKFNFIFSKF